MYIKLAREAANKSILKLHSSSSCRFFPEILVDLVWKRKLLGAAGDIFIPIRATCQTKKVWNHSLSTKLWNQSSRRECSRRRSINTWMLSEGKQSTREQTQTLKFKNVKVICSGKGFFFLPMKSHLSPMVLLVMHIFISVSWTKQAI